MPCNIRPGHTSNASWLREHGDEVQYEAAKNFIDQHGYAGKFVVVLEDSGRFVFANIVYNDEERESLLKEGHRYFLVSTDDLNKVSDLHRRIKE